MDKKQLTEADIISKFILSAVTNASGGYDDPDPAGSKTS